MLHSADGVDRTVIFILDARPNQAGEFMGFWKAVGEALFGKTITIVDPLFGEMARGTHSPKREGVWQWAAGAFDWPPQVRPTHLCVDAGDEGPEDYHRGIYHKMLENWGIIEVELEPQLLEIINIWVPDDMFVDDQGPTIDSLFDDVFVSVIVILDQADASDAEIYLDFEVEPTRLKHGRMDLGGHNIFAFITAEGDVVMCSLEG